MSKKKPQKYDIRIMKNNPQGFMDPAEFKAEIFHYGKWRELKKVYWGFGLGGEFYGHTIEEGIESQILCYYNCRFSSCSSAKKTANNFVQNEQSKETSIKKERLINQWSEYNC